MGYGHVLLWNRPSFGFFNQVIEQDFAPAAVTVVSQCLASELAL